MWPPLNDSHENPAGSNLEATSFSIPQVLEKIIWAIHDYLLSKAAMETLIVNIIKVIPKTSME